MFQDKFSPVTLAFLKVCNDFPTFEKAVLHSYWHDKTVVQSLKQVD